MDADENDRYLERLQNARSVIKSQRSILLKPVVEGNDCSITTIILPQVDP